MTIFRCVAALVCLGFTISAQIPSGGGGGGAAASTVPYSQAFSAVANGATVRVSHNQNTTKNEVVCRLTTDGSAVAIRIPDSNRTTTYTDVIFPASGGPFTGTCVSVAAGPGQPGQAGLNGVTPSVTIGTVTTVPDTQPATVHNSGSGPNVVLDIEIPKGQPGTSGASTASAVAFTPGSGISSNNVQAALAEIAAAKQNALGYTPENQASKGSANGYAGLDSGGKVPVGQLPAIADAQISNVSPTKLTGPIASNQLPGTYTAPKATALASTPTPCPTGQAAGGIDTTGNSVNCAAATGGAVQPQLNGSPTGSPVATQDTVEGSDMHITQSNNGLKVSTQFDAGDNLVRKTDPPLKFLDCNAGSASPLVCAMTPTRESLDDHMVIHLCVTGTITGATTLSVDTLQSGGVTPSVKTAAGANPSGTDLTAGCRFVTYYSSDNTFRLPPGGSGGSSSPNPSGTVIPIGFMLGADDGPALVDTNDQRAIWSNQLGFSVHLIKFWCQTDTGSAMIMLQRQSSLSNMTPGGITCDSTGVSVTDFVSGENAFIDGEVIDFLLLDAAVSGTPHRISLFGRVTRD